MMNRKIKVHKFDYDVYKKTDTRVIKLLDEEGKILLFVPIEKIAVNAFFRNFQDDDDERKEYESGKTLSVSTHKMFLTIMEALKGKIKKVVIDDLQGDKFFATMYFTNSKGIEYSVQAEACDALALALLSSPDIVYVKESVIDTAKKSRITRIYWYDARDEELLTMLRAYSHEELVELPFNEVEQLLEIAVEMEDFDFAARLKKALGEKNKKYV